MPSIKQIPEDIMFSPEEQSERERVRRQRLVEEGVSDSLYDKKQEENLLKELSETKVSPERKPQSREQIKEERSRVEKFMSGQGEGKEKGLEELMSDPSLVVQEPSGGYKCINQVEGEPCGKPAITKVMHGGLFGDIGPITLCEDHAELLKIVPLEEEMVEGEYRRKKSNISSILQKISKLANKLDAKGLYDEANLLDTIFKK